MKGNVYARTGHMDSAEVYFRKAYELRMLSLIHIFSGEMVKNVVVGTLMVMGWDVVDIDLASTPTTELAVTMAGASGGIILTASHMSLIHI